MMQWWTVEVPQGLTLSLPGIYEWRIGSGFVYIGKSKRLRRRIREYPNNVRKLIDEKPYRLGDPEGFRAVHYSLMAAHDQQWPVTVTILENCFAADLNAREQHWIEARRYDESAGGPRVLNADTKRERGANKLDPC